MDENIGNMEEESDVVKTSQFDLSIFHVNGDSRECKVKNDSDIIRNCLQLSRLIIGLKYYSLLDVANNKDDQDIFTDFMSRIYHKLLDDYNHLIHHHQDHLENINSILLKNKEYWADNCDITKCQFTLRHHIGHFIEKDGFENIDPKLNFYKQTMDNLHFYLFHLYDTGLRVLSDNKNDNNNNTELEKDDDFFDGEFNRITNIVKERQNITKSFNRFQAEKFNMNLQGNDDNNKDNSNSNKFNINIATQESEEECFIDAMYQHLQTEEIVEDDEINRLQKLIHDEEYDTDALECDVIDPPNTVFNAKLNKKCVESVSKFVRDVKMSSVSFAIGYIFYYWDYYKNLSEIKAQRQANVNDYGGHKISELYVAQKYKTLKEEISFYKYITMDTYRSEILPKALEYMKCSIVKKSSATPIERYRKSESEQYYDIEEGEPLTLSHIISICLYTDWSKLCTDFSSTFRKLKAFETLSSVRSRNGKYWWMAKHLREVVEIYGQNGYGVFDAKNFNQWQEWNEYARIDKLQGPFYSGMSFVMVIPEFSVRLCSPISTSKQLTVATKFAGPNGMVFTLNNNGDLWSQRFLRAFSCSWISNFKEEDEYLFFGGYYRTRIESISIIKTQKHYHKFLDALYYFDFMVSGGVGLAYFKPAKWSLNIIKHLIDWRLANNKIIKKIFPHYIYDTFECYCIYKKQINLNLVQLGSFGKPEFTELIMHSLKQDEGNQLNINRGLDDKYNDKKNVKMDKTSHLNIADKTNILLPMLFKLFPNAIKSVMSTANNFGAKAHSFSLLALLSIIDGSALQYIQIKNVRYEGVGWIQTAWKTSLQIEKQYTAKNYNISFQTITNVWGYPEDSLIIQKI